MGRCVKFRNGAFLPATRAKASRCILELSDGINISRNLIGLQYKLKAFKYSPKSAVPLRTPSAVCPQAAPRRLAAGDTRGRGALGSPLPSNISKISARDEHRGTTRDEYR